MQDSRGIHPPGIQVWHAGSSSSEPGALERCCENWLSQDERVRADRFRIPTSRNQHVVGRGMARRLLGREKIDPCDISFAVEKMENLTSFTRFKHVALSISRIPMGW